MWRRTFGGLPCRLVLMVVPPGCPVDLPCDCQAPRAPLPQSGVTFMRRRLAPSREALPSLLCSYGLMRQAFTLLPISGFALIRKVSAGCCQPLLRKGPCRVGRGVTTPTPHRTGCADFQRPVLHGRASLTAV